MNYVVMSVPTRRGVVEYLRQHIPNLIVVEDDGSGIMVTHQRALRATNGEPFVLLEDDVLLTQNFVVKAETVIAERQDDVITFFSRRKDDLTLGSRYMNPMAFYMAQCLYFPSGVGPAIADYHAISPTIEKDPTASDRVIAAWCKQDGRKIWISVPSLVEHLPLTSAVDTRRSKNRQSLTFSDPENTGNPIL
jgi:hypothetical protein